MNNNKFKELTPEIQIMTHQSQQCLKPYLM